MLRTSFFLRISSSLLALCAGVFADTVILKSGEKVDGKITSETDAKVIVEVQVSASIKEEREIKRAEIDKIEKVQADAVAWAQIKNIALASESYELADYARITGALQGFLNQYPQSAHKAEASAKLEEFKAEEKRVTAGELKLEGKWLSKEGAQQERIQVGGRILLSRMKRYAAGGQLIEALNTFDLMEKSYAGSAAMPDAIELARQVVPQVQAAAQAQKDRLKATADQKKQRLDTAQGQERETLAALYRNEAAANEAAAAAAEKSQVKWPPLLPLERPLSNIISRAQNEANVLRSKPVEKMRESIKLVADARAAIEAKDFDAAEKSLQAAQSAWNNNEAVKRLQEKIAATRKDAVASAEAAKKAEMEAQAAKVAAEKAAAEEAKKKAKEKAAADAAAAATATEEPAKAEEPTPLYKAPIFWVLIVILGGLGAMGASAYKKFRDPNRNLLDQ